MAGMTDDSLRSMSQDDRARSLGMMSEQLGGRSMFVEFDESAEERFTYPWAPYVDFNKRT